jgi:cob(I)alamin adenosyltransferase
VHVSYSDRAWSEAAQSDLLALGSLPSAWIPMRDALAVQLKELSSAERESEARRASAYELARIAMRWNADLPQYENRLSRMLFVLPLAMRRNPSPGAY